MPAVGIIVNPESGRDIRRLVAKATFVSNYAKIDTIKRFLYGLNITNSVDEVVFMPDFYGISLDIISDIKDDVKFKLSTLDMRVENTADDTINASKYMIESGVDVIVSAGGDGTLRAVYKGAGDKVPILGLSLGTNNVLGALYEPTVLGMMLGFLLKENKAISNVVERIKTIKLFVNNEFKNLALVDLTFMSGWYVGARAIWDEYSLRYAFISKGELGDIGIPSIASLIRPITFQDDLGLMVKFGLGKIKVAATLAPGLVKEVFIDGISILKLGQEVHLPSGSYVIAFDGEKEMVVNSKDEAMVRIDRDGPLLVSIPKSLNYINSYYREEMGELRWAKKY
ncbi:ATP-NAD kinase [Saccharolobus solfataricus]|uniref:Acetoin catabolism protein X homolog (AcoX) n=3 Tax=Saccharolobus solfataricus TaxID=2287 RepID=Q97Y21_SACS2|nr:ATP-NAD kinase family protein [Saccharolobus solfataricus]AAK41750.1 Acetoin catabolism protein X homolog (acoX) [Saccharolobus solfataricus P2]AKA74544.1 ATP-NAD kinase [Saccharolobus solfataricus]AKA77240.1 ATP-NAD kinase [Saccharolobus solfataricus]AKA79932.1 ATP-NAD kinase [Saccharolobus solfataricus]AZF69018.1 ATP-NAD kinase [Saccharolobus solfataricus]